MGIEALLSTQIIDTTAVGRAVMTAADAAAARTAIGAGTSSFSGAYSALSGIPSTFAPSAHKSSHATGGSDALTAADIGAAATSHTHAASDITSGTIDTARLASGTANSTTYLRGDQTWQTIAAGGISTLNTLTTATQTFATGTAGTNFGIVSTAGVHTFNLPDASDTARGVVTTGTQAFAGTKTFNGDVRINGTLDFNANNLFNFRLVIGFAAGASRLTFHSINANGSGWGTINSINGWSDGTSWWCKVGGGAWGFGTGIYGFTQGFYSPTANTTRLNGGTNPQVFTVANTYTSETSFELVSIGWASNVCTIETQKGSAGGTLRGLRIGGSSSALIALWGATPIVQPTTAVAAATRVGGGGTTLTDTDTFDGYTLAQIVKALRNIGALA